MSVPLSCPALRHSSRSSAWTTCSTRRATGASFSDAHAAMPADASVLASQALQCCESSVQLLRPSSEPVPADGRVLRLGDCAAAAARGATEGVIARVSRDAQTEGARRRWAHECALDRKTRAVGGEVRTKAVGREVRAKAVGAKSEGGGCGGWCAR